MHNPSAPQLRKWPFFVGDALLLGITAFICVQSKGSMGTWEVLACVLAVGLGAVLAVAPFLLEYRAVLQLSQTEALTTVVAQVRNIEQLAAQIGYATSQWQIVREAADKTAAGAKEIAQSMASEVRDFNEFLKKANEGEKSALRLEVDKLRRGEAEWLHVIVRILDHVFALHEAAVRSRQPGLVEQLGHFQAACRDAARRIGLTPFYAAPDEPFDSRRHQVPDGTPAPESGAVVAETLATGYTFQGKLLRPALVALRNGKDAKSADESAARPGLVSQESV